MICVMYVTFCDAGMALFLVNERMHARTSVGYAWMVFAEQTGTVHDERMEFGGWKKKKITLVKGWRPVNGSMTSASDKPTIIA